MALPMATASWIAPAVTILLLALPAIVIWRLERRRRRPDARVEEDTRPAEVRFDPPGRLPPVGRVSWDDFERRFAEYVDESSRPDDDPDRTAH